MQHSWTRNAATQRTFKRGSNAPSGTRKRTVNGNGNEGTEGLTVYQVGVKCIKSNRVGCFDSVNLSFGDQVTSGDQE